jgi:hypothetical protein
MEEWCGGGPYEEEKTSLSQKISTKKKFDIYGSLKAMDKDMITAMKIAQENLKKINTINKMTSIDRKKYNSTSEPGFLWQNNAIAAYYFFITMIGYIDSKIVREYENIDYYSKFINPIDKNDRHYEDIEKARKRIDKYMIDRNEVKDGFNSTIKEFYSSREFVDPVLDEVPSFKKFSDLYNDFQKNRYQLNLQIEFMKAYNLGLATNDYYKGKYDYEKRMNLFRRLFSDLTVFVSTNEAAVKNVKVKKNK